VSDEREAPLRLRGRDVAILAVGCMLVAPLLMLAAVVSALVLGEPGAAVAMILTLVVTDIALVPVPQFVLGPLLDWVLLVWLVAQPVARPLVLVWLAYCLVATGLNALLYSRVGVTRARLARWSWSPQRLAARANEPLMSVDLVLLAVALVIAWASYASPRRYAVSGVIVGLMVYLIAQWQVAERRGLLANPKAASEQDAPPHPPQP
jgi:hypothetical protein